MIGTGKGTSVLGLLSALNGMGDLAEPTFNPDFREAVMHSCLDPGLARKELQWEIEVSLEDGIRQTLNWFRSAHEPGGEQ